MSDAAPFRPWPTPWPAPWPIAAPSWVLPGDVLENCQFLAGRVEEVGLCLFESVACLDYPPDLWTTLAGLPLRYHLHLPLDLEDQPDPPAVCLALAQRAAGLSPWACVLHPTADPAVLRAILQAWEAAGLDRGILLLENIPTLRLESLVSLAYELEVGLCLDLGHLLLAGETPAPAALARCRLLHLSCPEQTARGHRHLGLHRLQGPAAALSLTLLRGAPGARRMVEVFDWDGLCASAAWLAAHDS